MAKKHFSNSIGLLAFISLIISSTCFILNKLEIGSGVLSTVGYACLLISVLWSAWLYVSNQKNLWKIIYLVLAILSIVSFLFGAGLIL